MLTLPKPLPRFWFILLPTALALAAVGLLLAAFTPTRQPALAAGDGGPVQNVETGLTYATLQAAIDAAETLDGHHLTVAAGVYVENVSLDKSLTITGAGQDLSILDGGGAGRVVYIPVSVTVALSGVAVRNGLVSSDYGGGIYSEGTLSLANSAVYSNTTDSYGGGIYNQGLMTLTNVLVYSNTADYAAGIGNDGALTLMGGEISYNNAITDGAGGFGNEGTASLTNVRIHHNLALRYAGGVGSFGFYLALTQVDIDHNTVTGGEGYAGGLDHETYNGPAILDGVRIFANRVISGYANYGGGGMTVFYAEGPLTMINSAVFDNFVGAGGPGGGIHASYDARLWIIDSAIYYNSTPGGLGGGVDVGQTTGGAEVTIINSTISGNSALYGGGLHSADVRVYMTNTTFYSNSATAGGNLSGTVTLANTLLAAGSPDNCDDAAGITSNGYNLEDATDTCGLAATGDLPNAAALLGPLARNGAALAENLSHLPRRDSDAIDAGSDAICVEWLGGHDQRGWARPTDGDGDSTATCDIGAVELGLDLFLPLILR